MTTREIFTACDRTLVRIWNPVKAAVDTAIRPVVKPLESRYYLRKARQCEADAALVGGMFPQHAATFMAAAAHYRKLAA